MKRGHIHGLTWRALILLVVDLALVGLVRAQSPPISVPDSTALELASIDYEELGVDSELSPCDPDDCLSHPSRDTSPSSFRYGIDGSPTAGHLPASSLGNQAKAWLRLTWNPITQLKFELAARKDAGEPVYFTGGNAWFLTETKRFSFSYTSAKVSLLVGDFRVIHGTGLISGSGWKPISSIASPTRALGSTTRHKSGVSGPGLPTRRGVSVLINPVKQLQTGLWIYSTRFPGSLENIQGSGAENTATSGTQVVTSLSGTAAFTSQSSIERRSLIQNQGIGGFVTWSGGGSSINILFEHAANRIQTPSSLDGRLTAFSLFSRTAFQDYTLGLEAAVINYGLHGVFAQLSKRSRSGLSVSFSYALQGIKSTPFSNSHDVVTTPSSALAGSLRITGPKKVTLSAGVSFFRSGQYSRLDKRQRAKLFAYMERKMGGLFELRVQLKHKLDQSLEPVLILDSGKQHAALTKNSELKFSLRSSGTRWYEATAWAATVWRNNTKNRLSATGALVKTRLPRWNVAVSWAVGHQDEVIDSRLPVYYSVTSLNGQFPVSASYGSSSHVSIFTTFRWNRTLFEVRYAESQSLLPIENIHQTQKSHPVRQVFQFQVEHTWD